MQVDDEEEEEPRRSGDWPEGVAAWAPWRGRGRRDLSAPRASPARSRVGGAAGSRSRAGGVDVIAGPKNRAASSLPSSQSSSPRVGRQPPPALPGYSAGRLAQGREAAWGRREGGEGDCGSSGCSARVDEK